MLVKAELETLKSPELDRGAAGIVRAARRLHLRDLSDRIRHILDPGRLDGIRRLILGIALSQPHD